MTMDLQADVAEMAGHATETRTQQPAAFILRQPVLDQRNTIVGYELVLDVEGPQDADHDIRLLGVCASPQISQLTEQKLTLITLSPAALGHPSMSYLPTKNMMVVLTAPQPATPHFISQLRALVDRGIRVALESNDREPAAPALIDVARNVRLDVSDGTGLGLSRVTAQLIESSGAHLIAGNLKCLEEFDLAQSMPFEYFQGQYFALGRYGSEIQVDQSRATVVELLNLTRQNAELRQIEAVFRRDPLLTYQLLRYINSPGCGLVHQARSIAHALMVLGYKQLYRWLTLLLFTRGAGIRRGHAYLTNALVRGRLMELLGRDRVQPAHRDSLFIVGVFSLLDAMLGVPIERALEGIQFTDEVEQALILRRGVFGPYLALALACENHLPEKITAAAAACDVQAEEVNAKHLDALVWSASFGVETAE